jgi:hypothetical protein
MVMDADEEADLVLAQTAILLDRQGDREAAQLLADVTYLDFENTDDSYRTSSGTHVYVMAAVLYVDDHLVSAFTGEVRERIAPVLIDVALRNGYVAVDRMYVKQVLPTVEKDWRSHLRDRAQERPTNQARRERTAPNHPVEDGLALGSRQEHQVYQVLKQIQATTPSDRHCAPPRGEAAGWPHLDTRHHRARERTGSRLRSGRASPPRPSPIRR